MLVDIEQVKKYNVPGPRYTSYPTAVQFSHQITGDEILRMIRENNESPRDLSLYFHIPFCRTLCWYCGCNTVITRSQSDSGSYIEYLAKEIDLLKPYLHPGREVVQIHFGGGTPTFLLPEEILKLGELIRTRFKLSADVEASVEVDPRRLTGEHLAALRDAGFNRASIGVQDFDPKVQAAINRMQSFEQTRSVIESLRGLGFQSISVDLIYGLPHQTVESFEATLDRVLSMKPDRLAVFSYAHVPWIKPAQKLLIRENALPSAETKIALLKLSVEKLTEEGYVYIGMDHFARRGDELEVAQREKTMQRNFQGYSTRGGADIYGFGNSSISQAGDVYWQNEKDLDRYYQRLDSGELPIFSGYVLNPDDRLRREVIMRLMCDLTIDFEAVSRHFHIDFEDYFRNELASLKDLEADGLVRRGRTHLEVTESGRLLVRNIAMHFDHYLPAKTEGVYSRTI